jgi:protein SCO1/2
MVVKISPKCVYIRQAAVSMYNSRMQNTRFLSTLAFILGIIVIGAGIGVYTSGNRHTVQSPEMIEGLLWPNPKQLAEFTIVDHRGEEFGLNNLQGKWTLLFFGYSYCPDVCPLTLTVLNQFYNDQQDGDIQVLFVTVDPERDTTARLAEYIGYFNKEFIGLGGTIEQIRSLATQIGIAYLHGVPADDGNYMVDHTSAIFLLDPKARLVSIISAPHNPAAIQTRFNNIKNFLRDQD